MSDTSSLTHLGSQETHYNLSDPSADILETFENQHPKNDYLVPFYCTEFTSICPMTGQPDFGKIHIMYVPTERMIESKSLKLYLFAFRNHGEFHEDCMNRIANDIFDKIKPKYIMVYGDFNIRGGIAIKPIIEKGDLQYRELAKMYFMMQQ